MAMHGDLNIRLVDKGSTYICLVQRESLTSMYNACIDVGA